MSQPWKQNVPLIDFQGNNGSQDGDPAAAYRYTESRLAEITGEMLRDIEKNTIDTQLTFDDTNIEPRVLPARFPNLLVNGSEGIAVGISTDIPPHNLGEVIEAAIYRIKNKKCTTEELREFILGPDFPTGGKIYKSEGLDTIYKNGEGRIEIEASYQIVEGKNINQIIINEIPFSANKLSILVACDKIRLGKDIDGIIEVRDETDIEGLRIVIDLKKDINPETILNYLLNKTELRTSLSPRMIAIISGRPVQFNLRDYLDAYLDHQVDVITRRSAFDLKKCQARIHIVDGLIKAVSIIDEVVQIIRHSKDKADSKTNLMTKFKFSIEQAEAIVMMRLHALSNTDIVILTDEKKALEAEISELEEILSNPKKLDKLLINDLTTIKNKYAKPRLTKILEPRESVTINLKELIVKENVWVSISEFGYIKRSSIKSYESSLPSLTGLKDGDTIIGTFLANTVDIVLCFTKLGYFLYVPINVIKETKWKDVGDNIRQLIAMTENDRIIRAVLIKQFRSDLFITSITHDGMIKKTKLDEFEMIKYAKPSRYMKLAKDDEVADVNLTNGGNDLTLITNDGEAAYLAEEDIAATGLQSSGIYGIKLTKDNYLVSLLISSKDERLKYVAITDAGAIRICDLSHLQRTQRLGRKQVVFKTFKSIPHSLIGIIPLRKKEDKIQTYGVLTNDQLQEIVISDFNVTPYERYVKDDNLKVGRNRLRRLFISEVDTVNKDTISLYRGEKVKDTPTYKEGVSEWEQMAFEGLDFNPKDE
jgi:topoisomerase-4 subunit A